MEEDHQKNNLTNSRGRKLKIVALLGIICTISIAGIAFSLLNATSAVTGSNNNNNLKGIGSSANTPNDIIAAATSPTAAGETKSIIVSSSSSPSQTEQQPPKFHDYTLIAENTTLEIAPWLRVDAWTYNGTIPGPTLTA